MSHTNEPWSLDQYSNIMTQTGQLLLGGVVTPMTTGIKRDTAEANARRIVACVNACAGFSTETLEATVANGSGVIRVLQKQRDELLITLETVSRNIASSPARVLEESVAVGNALQRLDHLQQRVVPALVKQRDELLDALKEARATLESENATSNGPIIDTIWHTGHETLFDFMDAAIAKAEGKE